MNFLKGSALKQVRFFSSTRGRALEDVVIVSGQRTPIGSFLGALSSLTAPQLGGIAIRAALSRVQFTDNNTQGLKADQIQDVYFGNVVSANLGQAPARQASISAGIPTSSECTTINKVCASGMKSITLAAQNIMLGQREIMIAGGMESMSNSPFYLEKARQGLGLGHGVITDSIIKDGLWDVYNNIHMGSCAEATAKKFNITREQQDAYAIESYKRATNATKEGLFKSEIAVVTLPGVKGSNGVEISEDEEYKKIKYDKVPTLRGAFQKDGLGTITAANSSKLNDGASAVVLMSATMAKNLNIVPLARIRGFADAAQDPIDFPTAPAKAVPKALEMAGVSMNDIALHEVNEAFAVVVLANQKILGFDSSKVNVRGGAVALGHPIGSSGCRIVITLLNALQKGQLGCASICNGGGGATALVIEKL